MKLSLPVKVLARMLTVLLVGALSAAAAAVRVAGHGLRVKVSAAAVATCVFSLAPLPSFAAPLVKGPDQDLSTRQIVIRKSNEILSSPLLEQVRKATQEEKDDESTLEPKLLLLPILDVQRDLQNVDKLLASGGAANFAQANAILNKESFATIALKRAFNRYSDNIFYTNPKQANLYLGGGAVPNTPQTTAYLYRNDVILAVQNLQKDCVEISLDERKVASKVNAGAGGGGGGGQEEEDLMQSVADARDDLRQGLDSLHEYLNLVDQKDLDGARAIRASSL